MIRQTDTIAGLSAALAQAQLEIRNADKDSQNPHFRSNYASLASVLDTVRPSFAKNGLAILQMPSNSELGMELITRILHSSGEWIESNYPVAPVKNDPQGLGSAITYARRYSLMSFAGIAAEDDDGNAASGNGNQQQQQRGSKEAAQQVLQNKLAQMPSQSLDDPFKTPEGFPKGVEAIKDKGAAIQAVGLILAKLTEQVDQKYAQICLQSIMSMDFPEANGLWRNLEVLALKKIAMKLFRDWQKGGEKPEPDEDFLALADSMVDIKTTVTAFNMVKARLASMLGDGPAASEYMAVLQRYGVQHSNAFKGDHTKDAKPALTELYQLLKAKEREVTIDDVPS